MWRIDDHTADVRIRASAATLQELFAASVSALRAVMEPAGETGERVSFPIEIDAADVTALLVDFLSEVLTRAHIERVAFDQTSFASLSATSLRATIAGARVAGFEEDVKSVTYHEADVARGENGWSVTLVLDI